MRLTALLPPPPIPSTTIRAVPSRLPWTFISIGPGILRDAVHRPSWQEIPQPASQGVSDAGERQTPSRRPPFELLLQPPLQQTDAGGESRRRDLIGQAVHTGRCPDANGRPEHLGGQTPNARQLGRSA